MRSWKARISNSRRRRARNSTTTRSVCSPTAIVGSARSRRTSRSPHPTGDAMIIAALFFYLFASICVASAVMMIASKNPVHSVLFLFVVMMLDVDFAELRQGFLNYLPIGGLIGIIFFVELVMILVLGSGAISTVVSKPIADPIPPLAEVTNTEALGRILY